MSVVVKLPKDVHPTDGMVTVQATAKTLGFAWDEARLKGSDADGWEVELHRYEVPAGWASLDLPVAGASRD